MIKMNYKGYVNASSMLIHLSSGIKTTTNIVNASNDEMNWFESKLVGAYNVKSKLLQTINKVNDSRM